MLELAWLILFFPALGALVNLFVGDKLGERGIHIVASCAVVLSFVISLGFSLVCRAWMSITGPQPFICGTGSLSAAFTRRRLC